MSIQADYHGCDKFHIQMVESQILGIRYTTLYTETAVMVVTSWSLSLRSLSIKDRIERTPMNSVVNRCDTSRGCYRERKRLWQTMKDLVNALSSFDFRWEDIRKPIAIHKNGNINSEVRIVWRYENGYVMGVQILWNIDECVENIDDDMMVELMNMIS